MSDESARTLAAVRERVRTCFCSDEEKQGREPNELCWRRVLDTSKAAGFVECAKFQRWLNEAHADHMTKAIARRRARDRRAP